MTSADLDPSIKAALNHLHSTHIQSAADIRVILDGLIKRQHGSSKMLVSRSRIKKHLAEEENAPGVMASLPEPLEILDSPPPAVEAETDDPENDVLQIDEGGEAEAEEDIEMNDDFNDLNCLICGSIMYSATNRLMECAECHLLYHQQCHSPNIEDDLVQNSWVCSNCKDKAKASIPNITSETSFPTKSSSSSDSSASSSPHRSAEVPVSKTGSSKSSSSSSSLKEESKLGLKVSSTNHHSRSEKRETSSSSSGKKHKSGSTKSSSSSSKDYDRKKKSK